MNEHEFLFLTWDMEFQQLNIYQNGKMIYEINSPDDLLSGIEFENETNQIVHIKLISKRQKNFLIKLDNVEFQLFREAKPPKVRVKKEVKTNVHHLSWFFLVLSVVHFLDVFTWMSDGRVLFIQTIQSEAIPIYWMEVNILLIVIYGSTFYFLRQNKGWFYLIGFPILLVFTVLEIYDYYYLTFFARPRTLYTVSIVIRSLIALVLLMNIRRGYHNIRMKQKDKFDGEVLDR